VLLGTVVALARDAEDPRPRGDGRTMSEQKDTLDAAILDSPVVVRVEVGSVSFTAREWAELRPGDVIEMGIGLAEPVVLRIAGCEVARGELVNVDGELGVRIRELVAPGRAP
jgi:flagellar motor switch/type III secretory pathway protein FliN